MNKSKKLSVFYILSSVALFLTLLIGGGYGIYVSIGLNFMRSSTQNIVGNGTATNVSFSGAVNFAPSMTGVIILSVILVVLSVFDFITLLKQIVFFKQYKFISNSKFEKKIEKQTKSKGAVIFWTILLDTVSFIVGIVGLFLNGRSFVGRNNIAWVLYFIDGLISLLALVSFVLLIAKLKNKKTISNEKSKNKKPVREYIKENDERGKEFNLNKIEYDLFRLNALKNESLISEEEYKKIRRKILQNDK